MTADWLLGWWNLIFIVPLGLALAYLFAYTLSGWTFGEFDFEADADVDVEADVDLEADADVDAEHDGPRFAVDADSEASGSDPRPGSVFMHVLSMLGVGRVPLSVILMVLLLAFGTIGFVGNQILRETLGASGVFVSLPIATLVALAVTAGVSRGLAAVIPVDTKVVHRRDLVGRRAQVIFRVDEEGGTIVLRDESGDRHQFAARVRPGVAPVPPGEEVVLVRYDADHSHYLVKAIGLPT